MPLCPAAVVLVCARAFTIVLALGVPLSALAPPAAAKVLGKDDRKLVPPKYKKLADGIGLLYDQAKNRRCTAFCIADDVIASNAHYLVYHRAKASKRPKDVRDLIFYLMNNGNVAHRARLKVNYVGKAGDPEMSILSGQAPVGGRTRPVRRSIHKYDDWAIAKLWWPACVGTVLKIADAKLLTNARALRRRPAYLIGFHGDLLRKKKDWRPRYAPCRIKQIKMRGRKGFTHHNCDSTKGASGSPIFVDTRQGPRVIAITTGSTRRRWYKRDRRGRRVITKRWTMNLAVLPLEFVDRIERFYMTSFVPRLAPKELSIEDLQQKLKAVGHLKAKVDGKFGPRTKAALMRFERAVGLVPLGLPTADLLEQLDARLDGQTTGIAPSTAATTQN